MTDVVKNVMDLLGREYLPNINQLQEQADKAGLDSAKNKLSATLTEYESLSERLSIASKKLEGASNTYLTEGVDYWRE
jgi:hypothetical protein